MGRNNRKPRFKAPSQSASGHDGTSWGGGLAEEAEDEDRGPRRRPTPEILYRNEGLVVVNKPAGLEADEPASDLASAAAFLAASGGRGEAEVPRAVYPLDHDASGVLVLAREDEMLDQLRRQIADGVMEVRYLALVRGRPVEENGTINRPLFDPGTGGGLVRADDERGQKAITEWRLRELYVGFALLECTPRTAVRSQIRAHLQSVGMPLIVDPRYGGGQNLLLSSFKADYRASRRREERPLIARLTLHAQSVRFLRPRTGEQLAFQAPPPKDMRATIHQLDRFGRLPSDEA